MVVANKGVSNALSPSKNPAPGLSAAVSDLRHPVRPRLTTSSTFPASNRIPQSRVPLPAPSPQLASSTVSPSPAKLAFSNTFRPIKLSLSSCQ